MEPYGGWLGSRQNCTGFHANGIPRCSALGHWVLNLGDEGYGLTGWVGKPEYITQPSLEWPKRVLTFYSRAEGSFPEFLS